MSKSKLFEVEDHVLEEVAKTFGRTVKSLNEDVEVLQEWMRTQVHLPELMSNKMLQNFLLLNKCSIEKTKEKIDWYYTVRSVLHDVFENINPKLSNLRKIMEACYFTTLPKLTPELYRIFAFKVRNGVLFEEIDPYDILRHSLNIVELRLLEDVTFGEVYVVDFSGVTTKFLMKVTPTLVYKCLVMLYEKVYSLRLKGVYIFNAPQYIEILLSMAKKVTKPKLFERIHISQDNKILLEKFPKSIIPRDFGGEEKSLDEITKTLTKKFMEYEKRFDQLDNLRVNESLRPEKLQNHEILGYHGNFKKLDID